MVNLQNGSVVSYRDLVSGSAVDAATGLPIQFNIAENGLSGSASVSDESDPKNPRVRGYSFDLSNAQVVVTMTDEEMPKKSFKEEPPKREHR